MRVDWPEFVCWPSDEIGLGKPFDLASTLPFRGQFA